MNILSHAVIAGSATINVGSTSKVVVDMARLHADLEGLYANPAASTGDICTTLGAILWMKQCASDDVSLTPAEQIYLDARELCSQVNNGGFAQWISNGYVCRASETREALTAIGAGWAVPLVDAAINALPKRLKLAIDDGDFGELFMYIPSEKRAGRFDVLDVSFYDQDDQLKTGGGFSELIVSYARKHRVGLN